MRTFILKARKAGVSSKKIYTQLGNQDHFEVVLHSLMQAFYVAADFREDVEFYLVLDGSADFPRTIKLSSAQGLSLPGFHELALLQFLQEILLCSERIVFKQHLSLAPGVEVFGFGLEQLVKYLLLEKRAIFILEPKAVSMRTMDIPEDPVFILSDHLMMPKKTIQGLVRQGAQRLSLGKMMLFASQCIVILHYELDMRI